MKFNDSSNNYEGPPSIHLACERKIEALEAELYEVNALNSRLLKEIAGWAFFYASAIRKGDNKHG